MSHLACLIIGIIIGVGLTLWGFASIPRNAARMFNTPPKGK